MVVYRVEGQENNETGLRDFGYESLNMTAWT